MTKAQSSSARAPAAPRLTREALVDAAMALADREGLDALTIRKLAGEIGVTPMALYWHVKDKDELLEALGERMFAEVKLPPAGGRPWPAELRDALAAVLASLKEHPSVAPLALHTVLTSEAGLEIAERVLGLLVQAGFEERATADIGAYLLSSIVTLVTAEPGAEPGRGPDELEALLEQKRARVAGLAGARFPTVTRLTDALLSCEDTAAYYERGLDLLVLGLQGLAA